ncbi:biliverdin-producing heme oxygenase [Saccharopolyspora taberi]|uniref:Biliverdin-producing heme oxygenase n=1 Tax=Saccharopolyspora taberi TaxID=60895 RepID=A0ABN3VFU2_9PSEU
MPQTAEPMGARFSAALRTTTWADHEQAESAGYMRAMLAGELPVTAYTDLVAQHYFAYRVLEEAAAAMREDPVAGRFVFDELTRLPALERDLEHLAGADWRERIRPNRATERYCERMREVCFDWPGGFVAHSYTRYLGDLSGGQAIRVAVERTYGFTGGDGVRFYLFPGIPKHREFKDGYRRRLDETGWSAVEQAQVIDEVRVAYRLNTEVLVELGRS